MGCVQKMILAAPRNWNRSTEDRVFFHNDQIATEQNLVTPSLMRMWTKNCQTLQFSSVQSLSHVQLFSTPWTAARQASLSITSSRSLPKFMSIESVMPPSHLILCRPLLLLPSIFPSIRVFSNESALCIRWPKYCPEEGLPS